MNVISTSLDPVKIVEPQMFKDERGAFLETYQQKRYKEAGIDIEFVQDNVSFSSQGTLRGLHYQFPHMQAKLVQVLKGEVFDVAVDIRKGSPTFGEWVGALLSQENGRQLFIPEGFAHGFYVVSESALFMYKCSDFYAPDCEGGVLWSDSEIGIDWPSQEPLLSSKDKNYPPLKEIAPERLPEYP